MKDGKSIKFVVKTKDVDHELKAVCDRIHSLISKNNYSYADIAKMTDIPKSAVHRYATGQTKKIPMERISILADALHTSPAYLMGWDKKEPPTTGGKADELVSIINRLNDKNLDRVLDYARILLQSQ